MNYQGHEQLRDDLAALSSTMSDLRLHIRALEVKYHDGCPALVDALAADFLRNLNAEYLTVYLRVLAFSAVFTTDCDRAVFRPAFLPDFEEITHVWNPRSAL